VRELQSHGAVTVDEALDALDTIIHKACSTSAMLAAAYPEEVAARLSRQLKSNEVGGDVIFEGDEEVAGDETTDDGPGAA
jgi:hypothetical protein